MQQWVEANFFTLNGSKIIEKKNTKQIKVVKIVLSCDGISMPLFEGLLNCLLLVEHFVVGFVC